MFNSVINTVASHEISLDDKGSLVDNDSSNTFSADLYSSMKYGDRQKTKKFGHELARNLVDNLPENFLDMTAPKFLVAYKAVPPACFYLTRYCLDLINGLRVEEGLEPGTILQVHKSRVTATNYANSSQTARTAELDSIDFTISPSSVAGFPITILDDIRITGGAERKILDVVNHTKPRSITLGYVALLDPKQACEQPNIEQKINTTAVDSILDVISTIKEDNFDLNIRTLKLLLQSNPVDIESFIAAAPDYQVELIIRGCIDTGPDFINNYRDNFTLISLLAKERGI